MKKRFWEWKSIQKYKNFPENRKRIVKDMFNNPPEKIICAAIRKEGITILGVRHFDKIMLKCFEMSQLNRNDWEAGFMTNKYRFVNRRDAWDIATTNDQLCWGKDRKPGLLFSEDLY